MLSSFFDFKSGLIDQIHFELRYLYKKILFFIIKNYHVYPLINNNLYIWKFATELALELDIIIKVKKEKNSILPKDFIKNSINMSKDILEKNIHSKYHKLIIKLSVSLIKGHYHDSHFKSKDNWEFAVESLKFFSSIDPKAVRQALKYKFHDRVVSIHEYQKMMDIHLGQSKTAQIISQQEKCATTLLNQNKNKIVFFNATFSGGGVAEMLKTAGHILSQVGIEAEWHTFYPSTPDFYEFTKKIHNTIQGNECNFDNSELNLWSEVGEDNVYILRDIFSDPQVSLISWEDPQVIFGISHSKSMMDLYHTKITTNWRCHVDISGIKNKNPNAIRIWNLIKSQIEILSESDTVIFQPFNTPTVEEHKCHIFTMSPGIDILKDKNKKIHDDNVSIILEKINHDCHTSINLDTPYLLSGARFDYWKNIPASIKVYEKLVADFPDIDLIVFGNFASDDPEGQDQNTLIREIIQNSEFKNKIHLVTNKDRELTALYHLGYKHKLPYIACSLREGFNIMTDEASMHGTVSLTSDSGGLKRYNFTEYLDQFHINIECLANKIQDSKKLYCLGETNSQASQIEEIMYQKLKYLLTMRRDSKEKYLKLYENASSESSYMSIDHSIIVMLKNYLMIASLNLDSNLYKQIDVSNNDEVISINVLSTMIDRLSA